MEPKCLDAHHLLVNLRCKVCKDGVWGIRKDAWHAVADSDNNIISKGIVVDLLDKQNNAFAKRTFSNEVEEQMRKLDFVSEANFCYMIRRWAFNINTSRRPVYPQHSLLPVTDKTEICVATYTECNHQIPQIYPRNHTFDSPSRLNKKQRKSKRSDVSKPNAVSRGCLPIRQHHKCDESKVLPTTRLGIELQD
ncbi:unnamed protein product [Mytilus edulis]|uniref:Uncharacterized protein n=1 Tax=Mytilus edulis TaxID=6550 RepID=A0A8S3QCA5_MYTED|nr:unnamed protein product [Mytilus edulis]